MAQDAKLSKAQKKELKRQKRREKYAKKWEKQRKLLFPADKNGRHKNRLMNFFRVFLLPVRLFLFRYKLHGNRKVGLGAYIYVGNHYSIWDPFVPSMTTREGVHYIVKQPLMEAPFLGYFVRRVGCIGAMRDGSDVRSIMDSVKILRNGEKIAIFPEGTRNKISDEEFLPFHGGAALLAIKTKTPIIPFVICTRPRVFHRTHVVIGEPMELSEYYDRKLTAKEYEDADEKLKNKLYELRTEFCNERAAKKAKKKGKRE